MYFFYVRKKIKFVCLIRGSRHLRPTVLCNERVLQHDTIFFVQSFAVRCLRLWHVLKENCGANVWNLKSCIYLYACRVIEPFCITCSNKRYDRGALFCSKGLKIVIELTWRAFISDVVETVTSETETETWLRFRDETESETLS